VRKVFDLVGSIVRHDGSNQVGPQGVRVLLMTGVRVPTSVGLFSDERKNPTKVGTLTPVIDQVSDGSPGLRPGLLFAAIFDGWLYDLAQAFLQLS
jgi:hypothetical protein